MNLFTLLLAGVSRISPFVCFTVNPNHALTPALESVGALNLEPASTRDDPTFFLQPCVLSLSSWSDFHLLTFGAFNSDKQVLAIMICATMGGLVKRGADPEADPHRFLCFSQTFTSSQKSSQVFSIIHKVGQEGGSSSVQT